MTEHTHPEEPDTRAERRHRGDATDTTDGGGDPSRRRYAAPDLAARYHQLLEDTDGALLDPSDLDGSTLRLTRQDHPDPQP